MQKITLLNTATHNMYGYDDITSQHTSHIAIVFAMTHVSDFVMDSSFHSTFNIVHSVSAIFVF